MNVIGVANHTPDKIVVGLRKRGLSVRILHVGGDLPKRNNKDVTLFLTVGDFRRNMELLNTKAYANSVGILFASPIMLYRFTGIVPLDYKESADVHLEAFEFIQPDLTSALAREAEPITYDCHADYADKVLEKVQSFTGILTPFMTFIYSMPSSTHQKPVKELGCYWLASTESETDLCTRIAEMQAITPLNDKQVKRFTDILTSDNAGVYRTALAATHKFEDLDSRDFITTVSDHGVSAYEIRYIRSILRQATTPS